MKYLLDQTNLALARNWLIKSEKPFIPGSSSIYIPSSKSKLIWRDRAYEWPNLEGETEWMTASEVARVELKREFGPLERVKWGRHILKYLYLAPPIFFDGQFQAEAVYFDIKAAYATIYKKLGINMRFPRELHRDRWAYELGPVATRLWDFKTARNAVVGIIRSTHATLQTGQKTKRIYPENPYLNPHLWLQVQAILHEIANNAVQLGAVYVNTDGFIFPYSWSRWQEFEANLQAWGFNYEVAFGFTDISGWGSYSIDGHKTTEPYKTIGPPRPKPFSGLSDRFKTTKNVQWWSELL